MVQNIFLDSKKRYWVGTNKGLDLLTEEGTFERITNHDGLSNDKISAIEEDDQGNLWISTKKGLIKFNYETDKTRTYQVSDGLQSNEFGYNVSFKDEDGLLYFGGGKGLNVFHPDSIQDNPILPKVYLTQLKIFNQPVEIGGEKSLLPHHISQAKALTLSYRHSVFTLDYVGLNLTNTKKNEYAYKLEGLEESWNYVGKQRNATYTNLDPGPYTFRVKASNNDRIWNEVGTSLAIVVLPPWWKTWWAYVLYFILAFGSIIGLIRVRTQYISKQKQALQMLVDERTQELNEKNVRIAQQSEELLGYNESLNLLNKGLEQKVDERTLELSERNIQLAEFAFINAHNLRLPITNILGIIQLFEVDRSPTETREMLELLKGQSESVDKVLIDIQAKLEAKGLKIDG